MWKLQPDATTPPTGAAFATGVPGTNGLAFDGDGNLWTGDGTTGQGRVWKIASTGGDCAAAPPTAACTEAFRIPPMRNGTELGGQVAGAGVGRENRTVQPPPTASNPQNLVANGLAFTREGDLFIADTARGAIWEVAMDRHGNPRARTGCDSAMRSWCSRSAGTSSRSFAIR